jgi:hypothetical protein
MTDCRLCLTEEGLLLQYRERVRCLTFSEGDLKSVKSNGELCDPLVAVKSRSVKSPSDVEGPDVIKHISRE